MKSSPLPFRNFLIFISVLILALSTGCKSAPTTQEPAIITQSPTAEVTAAPTVVTQKLLLVDPAGTADSTLVSFLTEFATSNNLVYETINSDTLPSLGEETRVVIFLNQPENIRDIASASPQTQFVVSGTVDPSGLSNLSVIKAQPQDMAFMAGYLTTLVAWDWRSGGLIPNDTPQGAGYAEGFENGGRYVCGQCTPFYAPYYYFPLIVEESSTAGASAWQTQIVSLNEYYVDSVYVDPAAALPEVMDSLTAAEYTLIGKVGTASPERFTVLLDYDLLPGLQTLLPQLLAGSGGQTIPSQVKIAFYTNEELISPAKIELFNQVAASLTTGWVSPMNIQ